MSYNVAICVPPISPDDKDAWEQIDGQIDEQGPAPPEFHELISRLTARYPCLCDLPDDQIDDGVWSDGPLRNNVGNKATVLGMSYSRVSEVLPFLIETSNSLGLIVFDWAVGQIYRGDGIKGLSLTVEGEVVVLAPRLEHAIAAIHRLTPNGGPGFIILEGFGSDYTQAAGGEGVFTVEWREFMDDTFRHWVAGRPESSSELEVVIPTNGFQLTVRENERLTVSDVGAIFSAFAKGRGRPTQFTWRDITDRFV